MQSMIACILASGQGVRLRPLTDDIPKPLCKVGGEALLSRLVRAIRENGMNEVVVTTGFRAEKIELFFAEHFPDLKVTSVFNEAYGSTNAIYSLWLARNSLQDDIVLMHGDIICDPVIFKEVVDHASSCALVKKSWDDNTKDFRALIVKNRITKIQVGLDSRDSRFLLPLYKFKEVDMREWMGAISKRVEGGEKNIYPEYAFNDVAETISLEPVYFEKELAMEVDNFDDLKTAEKLLAARK